MHDNDLYLIITYNIDAAPNKAVYESSNFKVIPLCGNDNRIRGEIVIRSLLYFACVSPPVPITLTGKALLH